MTEFIEYPKCLYKQADFSGETLTVTSSDQEEQAKSYGWMTCEQLYGLEPMPGAQTTQGQEPDPLPDPSNPPDEVNESPATRKKVKK